ncbi:MAG: Ger(x)C family spore germination protein [Bacillota bacterium]|nr:Ger(x)C family spore germination protein [Bacillota bacterium]
MKKLRIALLTFIILINGVFAAGCWNYKEIDKLSIVAGVAVDKGIDYNFQVTAEVVDISTGRDSKITSKTITAEGKTMFDAARNMISLFGKRLYWGHAKVIILSKEIAGEGVTRVIDWYNRDSETRDSVHILVSREESAKEILEQGAPEDIKSFTLDEIIRNEVSLSKAPAIDILTFDIESKTKGISEIVPAVHLKKSDGEFIPELIGTAIIKNDKLAGFLNGEETKDLIFIRNKVKGGVLNEEIKANGKTSFYSLEIFKNKTKVTPAADGKNIEINLNIDTTVAIDEIYGIKNFSDEKELMKMEESAENTLRARIESLIKKMQLEYDADIFGFGEKLRENKVKAWNSVSNNWDETFKYLKVNVKTRMHIKNSALLSKTLKEGD